MNMPKHSKWRKRSKLYCFQKVIFVRPKLSVVQQAQNFPTFFFHDMGPCGLTDVSKADEDFSLVSKESLGPNKKICHSLSNLKMRSGSRQFFRNFFNFAFFGQFEQKTPKYVNFDDSCTGAVQGLLREKKMSDKSVEVLKMKLQWSTFENSKNHFLKKLFEWHTGGTRFQVTSEKVYFQTCACCTTLIKLL